MTVVRILEIANFRAIRKLRWLPGPGIRRSIISGRSVVRAHAGWPGGQSARLSTSRPTVAMTWSSHHQSTQPGAPITVSVFVPQREEAYYLRKVRT